METMVQDRRKKTVAARPKDTVRAGRIATAAAAKPTRATTARKSAAPRSGAATASFAPAHEEIASRAHALYVQSGCAPGRDEEFWLEAERQLLAGFKA